MNACVSCGKIVEKDAKKVEHGMDYICAICLAHSAHTVERAVDSMSPTKKKRTHKRCRSPKGSEVSLGGYDFSKTSKRRKNESSEISEGSLQTESD